MMSKIADDIKPKHMVLLVLELVVDRITGSLVCGGSREANQSRLAGIIAAVIVISIPPIVLMVASYFINSTTEVVPKPSIYPAPVVTEINIEIEREYWKSVENHPSEQMYRLYLKKYPEGEFKEIALNAIKEQQAAEAKRVADEVEAKRIADEAEAKRIATYSQPKYRDMTPSSQPKYRDMAPSSQPKYRDMAPTIAKRNEERKLKPRSSAPHSRDDL